MPTARFRFGDANEHELLIQAGLLGSERYYVDGELVHKTWSYKLQDERRILSHGHEIRIVGSFGLRTFATKAYVNGKLHVEELFPTYAAFVAKMSSVPILVLRLVVLVAAVALTYLYVSGRPL